MKAVIYPKYGSADVLQFQEIDKPVPKDNEVLIRIYASVVTPADCAFRKADPFIVRFMYGFTKPRYSVLGVELAGEIEAVGNAVKSFKAGDRVVALSKNSFGAHAEYKCLSEDELVVRIPDRMSYEEAVGVCDGAPTALFFLRDIANIQSGQKVLVNGASGAVGIFAVQLAKYYGAEVAGVCSSANAKLVKAMGADKVIDYTKEDFTGSGQRYDVIFDAVGKSSFGRCKRSLTQKGVFLSTVPSLAIMLQMLWTSKLGGGKKAKFTAAGLKQTKENLNFLNELFEAGKIKPFIDRRYTLEQTADAHRYVEKGHKKGNVVITI